MDTCAVFLLIIILLTRLDLKSCSFAVTRPWLQVGLAGRDFYFFILVKVSFFHRALPLFDISLIAEKKPSSATIIIINSDKALVNQCNEGIRFN